MSISNSACERHLHTKVPTSLQTQYTQVPHLPSSKIRSLPQLSLLLFVTILFTWSRAKVNQEGHIFIP